MLSSGSTVTGYRAPTSSTSTWIPAPTAILALSGLPSASQALASPYRSRFTPATSTTPSPSSSTLAPSTTTSITSGPSPRGRSATTQPCSNPSGRFSHHSSSPAPTRSTRRRQWPCTSTRSVGSQAPAVAAPRATLCRSPGRPHPRVVNSSENEPSPSLSSPGAVRASIRTPPSTNRARRFCSRFPKRGPSLPSTT